MGVTQMNAEAQEDEKGVRSALKSPWYSLPDSLQVPDVIYKRGGGKLTADEIAAYLNYRGVNNGAFKARINAARMFGLIEKSGDKYVLTQTAQSILIPIYEW